MFNKIQWRTLTVGLILQFLFGVFILRVEFGYQLFAFLGLFFLKNKIFHN